MTAAATAAAASTGDGADYADRLRKSLVEQLFDGEENVMAEDGDKGEGGGGAFSIDDYLDEGFDAEALQDIDRELDDLADHEVIRGILEQGRVVKEFALGIDDRLRQAEMESINEYIMESGTMVALHDQIRNSDSILSGMEQLLGRFQSDLGRVSEEIRQLQVQSQTMGTKLRNRRATEQQVGSFIESVAVSEHMVASILDSEVDENYLEYLLELDKKLRFMSLNDVAKVSQSKRDLEPALEKLRIKAVSKVRDFLLQNMNLLKRPKTNLQIIQQTSLLRYKHFIRFLAQHGADVYSEIRGEYISIMSRILSSYFRTYLSGMEKMQVAVAHQADVLGVPEPGASSGPGGGGVLTGLFNKVAHKAVSEHVFELGDRALVLQHFSDQAAIVPHVAESEGAKFPYEVVFRNVHKLLMDTATSEFFFCCDFFEDEAAFRELFAPIITSVVESDLANALQDNYDILSVLLMIRINHGQRQVMTKRRVPCLDDYLDRVQLLLWPRFKILFDGQLSSVRSGTERVLFQESVSVHGVVKRYAALASSMLLLMAEYDSDESGLFKAQTFYDMMDRLWAAMFDLLLRMSNQFKDKSSGIIFLIINYAHIVAAFKTADAIRQAPSGGVSSSTGGSGGGALSLTSSSSVSSGLTGMGKTGATAIKDCEDQLQNCTGLYVEDQLSKHFPILAEFVKKAEQQQKRLVIAEGQHIPNFAPAQASPILRDFTVRWKDAIEDMHREVTKHFVGAPACIRDVLQALMTSLLKYYTRLLEILKRQGPEGQAMAKDAPNVPSIMYEIKRITKA